MPPSHVRWMRRYDGGRFSFVATVYAGSLGLLMRLNWDRIHSRLNRNRSTLVGSTNGLRYSSSRSGSIRVRSLMNPSSRSPCSSPSRSLSDAIRISRPIASGNPLLSSLATAP